MWSVRVQASWIRHVLLATSDSPANNGVMAIMRADYLVTSIGDTNAFPDWGHWGFVARALTKAIPSHQRLPSFRDIERWQGNWPTVPSFTRTLARLANFRDQPLLKDLRAWSALASEGVGLRGLVFAMPKKNVVRALCSFMAVSRSPFWIHAPGCGAIDVLGAVVSGRGGETADA